MSRAGTALATLCVVIVSISASTTESQRQQLLRILADKPSMQVLLLWQLPPRTQYLPPRSQDLPPRTQVLPPHSQEHRAPAEDVEDSDNRGNDDAVKPSEKRSAVATALNTGRRRRQPTPAVGVLNDMETFFDSLRDNLELLASLTPQQRAKYFAEKPRVVAATSRNSVGGGLGFRNLYALRPLKPTGDIRFYNRRSYDKIDGAYPAANKHDPALLWTGLGR